MKKIIMSVALSVLTFTPSWSSDSEFEHFEDTGVFGSQFELDEQSPPKGISLAPKDKKKKKPKFKSSDPILISQGDTINSGKVIPSASLPEAVGSFQQSSFMESYLSSQSFKPGSYESHQREKERRRNIEALNNSFHQKRKTTPTLPSSKETVGSDSLQSEVDEVDKKDAYEID